MNRNSICIPFAIVDKLDQCEWTVVSPVDTQGSLSDFGKKNCVRC